MVDRSNTFCVRKEQEKNRTREKRSREPLIRMSGSLVHFKSDAIFSLDLPKKCRLLAAQENASPSDRVLNHRVSERTRETGAGIQGEK